MMGTIVLIILQLLFDHLSGQACRTYEPDESVHIYVLMGQSNMAGRGKITDEFRTQRHERVVMLDSNYAWLPARHPIHFDKPKMAGVGPGLSFGIEMAESKPNTIVGLVPCAVGGTSIGKWVPGGYDSVTRTYPYDDAIARIRKAKEKGMIKGVLWQQGESDSDSTSPVHYLAQLHELIDRIRAEVGDPQLPVVVGELGRYKEDYQYINKVLAGLPAQVHNVVVVSSENLWHNGDGIHFDSPSASEYGKRFAEGMQQLQQALLSSLLEKPQIECDILGKKTPT